MEIVPLNWDSDFFGIRIAKATVTSKDDISALARMERKLRGVYDLIYVFSDIDEEIPFNGSFLVDKKAVFSMSVTQHWDTDSAIEKWESERVSEELVSLALTSGEYSRFRIDSLLPVGSFERLYTRWIEQSVNKSIATEVFCYMLDNTPRGLLTLNRADDHSTIGLVAVDMDYQNKGIGTALVRYAISFVYEHNGKGLSVTTQLDNMPACLLYSKCGFTLESITKIWHWWL